ncbi:hypothetical protein J2S78_002077 [Salibacterium salarium]|uniref:hypothetical protein n=1 Tax=Salibacterium salarium TaxID=284579 RepID=UPI00278B11CD|nr:hypothetical protein [Salibacterium salarium]MDQ0299657.1 hypothetical protein [Salibacterium salarium]
MCLYGVYKKVYVINPDQSNTEVFVDACISDEIQQLNDQGIITLGCCCNHGTAGENVEWENAFGIWKSRADPPVALIQKKSVQLARHSGYNPYPYYYADGISGGVWQMPLKTGCITKQDCEEWHRINQLPLEKNIGVIKKESLDGPLKKNQSVC